jgi:hypothetical protein
LPQALSQHAPQPVVQVPQPAQHELQSLQGPHPLGPQLPQPYWPNRPSMQWFVPQQSELPYQELAFKWS